MNFENKDILILKALAQEKLEISSSEKQFRNIRLWTDTNDLHMTIPPVYIDEIPWHEMNVNDELTLQTSNPYYRSIENSLRKEIYSWKHMPGNMVIKPMIECPMKINDSGFGISEDVDIVKTDVKSPVVSRHFNIQIKSEEDIYKIKDPVITLDNDKTEENYNKLKSIFDGILEVKKTGVKGLWFTPWDNLVRWTGIAEAMMDLIDRPEYIEKLVERFVDASIVRLNQYEKLGVWASNNNNTRVGSGGYGYCSILESPDKYPLNAPLKQLWGCGNSQIFSEVSPDMHWEFSLKHELRWIERFGLSYYGCCEPLHNKTGILERIPNLRKISMSPWAKLEKVRDFAKGRYVLSCKPSPAIFAGDYWSEERAKADIINILKQTDGSSIEIVMKDISTVSYKPQRLWEWSRIALQTIEEYYN
jgi:CRISPR/Cas system CSM-associated protein Csm2 small subunit